MSAIEHYCCAVIVGASGIRWVNDAVKSDSIFVQIFYVLAAIGAVMLALKLVREA